MTPWRCLLLVYARIDVRWPHRFLGSRRFAHELPLDEVEEAIASFRCFPALVEELTRGEAGIGYDIVHCDEALGSLTKVGEEGWWPSPQDTRPELERYVSPDKYDSVFVLWPQNDLQQGRSIPSWGWGLGMGAHESTMGATYATVANTESWIWQIPRPGEVWLHEWLHGVCAHFQKRGHRMPDGDADGGGRHGYVQSPVSGWTDFYRDLMNGEVLEDGVRTGIPLSAWRGSSKVFTES